MREVTYPPCVGIGIRHDLFGGIRNRFGRGRFIHVETQMLLRQSFDILDGTTIRQQPLNLCLRGGIECIGLFRRTGGIQSTIGRRAGTAQSAAGQAASERISQHVVVTGNQALESPQPSTARTAKQGVAQCFLADGFPVIAAAGLCQLRSIRLGIPDALGVITRLPQVTFQLFPVHGALHETTHQARSLATGSQQLSGFFQRQSVKRGPIHLPLPW